MKLDSHCSTDDADIFQEDWNQLVLDDVKFSLRYLDNHTASCGFSNIDKYCDDCVDGKEVGENEEGMNMTFKRCQILLKHTQLMKLLNHSFMCKVIVNMMKRTF
jgi:hypothetical protein